MPPLRLAFLGSDPIALPLLDWMAGQGAPNAQVVAVFTQPDRATGRGQKVVPNAIKQWALARGIPLLQPEKLTEDVRLTLGGFSPDVSLVMAYGHILREEFIATPRLGTLNLHTSLLPKYRGASPIQTAIANGETETGVTLMRMVRQLDAGPVADVERVAIMPPETAVDVEAKLAAACVPLLARTLPALRDGTLTFVEQNDAEATFCRKLTKDDGALDFASPAAVLAARINGLFPWPACSVEVGGVPVKFGCATALPQRAGQLMDDIAVAESCRAGGDAGEPGQVLGGDGEALRIGTTHGVVCVHRLQRPGGKMLPAPEFLRGFAIPPGTRLPSRPMPVLVANAPFRKKSGPGPV